MGYMDYDGMFGTRYGQQGQRLLLGRGTGSGLFHLVVGCS